MHTDLRNAMSINTWMSSIKPSYVQRCMFALPHQKSAIPVRYAAIIPKFANVLKNRTRRVFAAITETCGAVAIFASMSLIYYVCIE